MVLIDAGRSEWERVETVCWPGLPTSAIGIPNHRVHDSIPTASSDSCGLLLLLLILLLWYCSIPLQG
eukprot:3825709-Prorocentrum_lima.AAC.1